MNKLLSICIPVYNRIEEFRVCLERVLIACKHFSNRVEIVISDNNSEDDIPIAVNDLAYKYGATEIVFVRNQENIGMVKNFLQVVDMASGKFCWLIGSDDFIKPNSVKIVLETIEQNRDVKFLCCNYDLINIDNILRDTGNQVNIDDVLVELDNRQNLIPHNAPTVSKKIEKLIDIIDPEYNNVFLGAVMTGIFDRSLWNSVDKMNVEWGGFNSLASIYPHCYIYAKTFLHEAAFYFGEPLVTVGEGRREWADDNGISYWKSSLPLIHLKIIPDMVENYNDNGLSKQQYRTCNKYCANLVGSRFIQYVFKKITINSGIKDGNLIKSAHIIRKYWTYPQFYMAQIRYIYQLFKRILKRNFIHNGG